MGTLERAEVERALSHKGFKRDDEKKSHRYYRLFVNGKKTDVFTKVSHGSDRKYKTLGDPLVGQMARQLKISRTDLAKLIECSLNEAGYVALVRQALQAEGRQL